MMFTANHRLRQQCRSLEGFLEAHGEVVSPGLSGSTLGELLACLREDRRRLRAADRRVALRLHEAAVARRRRRAAVAAVRRRLIALRGLVAALYGPLGPRYLLILRCAISRHPASLDGQARRAVHALRVRAAEGVRLRFATHEISLNLLADALETLQLELAAAVTEGFRTAERLFAAQVDRGICRRTALQRLRTVRDVVWRACHRVREPRLAAQVRKMLMRRAPAVVRDARSAVPGLERGVREPRRRGERPVQVHRASDTAVLADSALVRTVRTGLRGSRAVVRSSGTAVEADLHAKTPSARADQRLLRRDGASTPGVRPSRDFLKRRPSKRGLGALAQRCRRWGRGPPARFHHQGARIEGGRSGDFLAGTVRR